MRRSKMDCRLAPIVEGSLGSMTVQRGRREVRDMWNPYTGLIDGEAEEIGEWIELQGAVVVANGFDCG